MSTKRPKGKNFYIRNISKSIPPLNRIRVNIKNVVCLIVFRLFKNALSFGEEALSRCYKQNRRISINDNYWFTWLSNKEQFTHR